MKFIGTVTILLGCLALFGESTIPANAITPTPAPSKTPVVELPLENQRNDSDDNAEGEQNDVFEPFTQDDLTVLTGNVQRPNGIDWFNGNLYTSCNGDWTLYELDAVNGDTITYSFGVRNAHTLFVEQEDNSPLDLWIPDYDVNALVRVTGQASPIVVADDIDGPWGIDYLDEDNFLITSLLSNAVLRVNRDGSKEVLTEELRSPTGIVIDQDVSYVANNGSSRRSIEWFELENVEDDLVLNSLVSGLQNTTGMVLADDGLLYFTYALGTRGVVGRVDPEVCMDQGGCTNDEVEVVLYTELAAPLAGLEVSPEMRLFVHTIYRPEIYWVDLESDTTAPSS